MAARTTKATAKSKEAEASAEKEDKVEEAEVSTGEAAEGEEPKASDGNGSEDRRDGDGQDDAEGSDGGAKRMVVVASKLNVRDRPNMSGNVVKVINEGTDVEVESVNVMGWARLSDGTYVVAKYLK